MPNRLGSYQEKYTLPLMNRDGTPTGKTVSAWVLAELYEADDGFDVRDVRIRQLGSDREYDLQQWYADLDQARGLFDAIFHSLTVSSVPGYYWGSA